MGLLWQRTWAVGGGKGGVGKSFVSAGLAAALAHSGYRVVLVDADRSNSDMHELFGIKYVENSLDDFLKNRVERFYDILAQTPLENLQLMCGASSFLEIANPSFPQRQRLLDNISGIDADYIVIDMGDGTSYANLDFFGGSDRAVVVTTAEPPSIQNAYSFLRMSVYKRLLDIFSGNDAVMKDVLSLVKGDGRIKTVPELMEAVKKADPDLVEMPLTALGEDRYRLIINKAAPAGAEKVSKAVAGAASDFLGVKLIHVGTLSRDDGVDEMTVPELFSGGTEVSKVFKGMAENMAVSVFFGGRPVEAEPSAPGPNEEIPEAPEKKGPERTLSVRAEDKSKLQTGLNNEILYDGVNLHIQTEDLGRDKEKIRTLVFSGGQILFSKISDYGDFKAGSVSEMVIHQHKVVMAGIKAGKLKDKLPSSGGITPPS